MNRDAFQNLLALGVRKGASDIHFEVGYPPVYRINGELLSARLDRLTADDTRAIAEMVVNPEGEPTGAAKLPREADRSFSVSGLSRFRVNILQQRGSLGLVMRVIPFEVRSFQQLNLPPVVQAIAAARQGLILVTGATGNGKSSTIAAMLDQINQNDRLHIVTIEDPIEFVFGDGKSVLIQREVGTDTEDFQTAIRAALRQDPDVIMVGELRDRETAEICLKAAETGHLVITSIHTPDATRSIGRLVGMFPSDDQASVRSRLIDNLKAIVSQRLLPRQDGAGLIPAVEVMLTTLSIADSIRDPAKTGQVRKLIEQGRVHGMQSFDQHLGELFRAQLISAEVAKTNASSPADFEREVMLGVEGQG
ncbi:MAG TPA: PilT/PilU family type 4a pilus ATPase [Myxococcales bacterium]|nr:PilT/PilU family type 4a pilus ATPase [Myxococcales bacterium]